MEIRPDALDRRARYRLMTSLLVPRPIAWVSSLSAAGIGNLAPFSFYGGISASPPLFGLSVGRRAGEKKDTWRNLEQMGEAVLHVVTEELAGKMVLSSGDFPPDVDEFGVTGLTPFPSILVKPPRIAEASVAMECTVERMLELGDPAAPVGFFVVRLLLVHVRDDLWKDGAVRVDRLRAIGRLSGQEYCRIGEPFTVEPPDTEAELGRYRRSDRSSGVSDPGGGDCSAERGE